MPDYSGRLTSYGAAKETVRGTAQATAAFWLPQLEASFQDKQTKTLNNSALGIIDQNNDAAITELWSEGTIVGKVNITSIGLLLLAALGTEAVGTVTNGTYVHTFTRNNTNLGPSLTLFRKTPNNDLKMALACLKSLVIEVATGEYVKYTADFVSKQGVTTTSTVAYTDELEFTSKYVSLKQATNLAGLSGATAQSFKSATITIERDVEAYYEMGSVAPAEIHNKSFNVTVEVEKRHSDDTYKTFAMSNTTRAIEVRLTNTDDVIGTAQSPEIVFTLPKIKVTEWEVDQGIDDIVMESMTFQGMFSIADGYQLQATLKNTQSTAY